MLRSPDVSGNRNISSGLFPAMHAAVANVSVDAVPAVMTPHSAPVSSASLLPAASASSSKSTKASAAAFIAAMTSSLGLLAP
ncbi:hypothetical protein LMTR3_20975 [Bradyrhizobium sp. LMTR 3]|nr:hypothetical protein LMTR3_20975 [Bradyrhizobium sp. LMTR 3]